MNDFVYINDNIAMVICFLVFMFVIYRLVQDNNIIDNMKYDYQTVVVSVSDYNLNLRTDKTIELRKKKENDTYILELDKEDGYYVSFHVIADRYISIGTNVDKSCKFNDKKEIIIPLINQNKIKIIDPD